MVECLRPEPGKTIADPRCGSGGFFLAAQEMMATLMEQVARVQGIDDHLKTTDQMRWVQMMNNVRAQAEEIVAIELLYV